MKFTKVQLLEYAKAPKVNINMSANFMSVFGLADKFGSKYNLSDDKVFLKELQKLSSVDLSGFTYKEPLWVLSTSNQEVDLVKLDTILPEDKEIVVEGITEASVTKEEPPQETTPDWDWVDSLEDSPETRLELDEYALKFSVRLKRPMKVSNMAKKFKAEFKLKDL